MVQKSGTPSGIVLKPCKSWDKLPTSTGYSGTTVGTRKLGPQKQNHLPIPNFQVFQLLISEKTSLKIGRLEDDFSLKILEDGFLWKIWRMNSSFSVSLLCCCFLQLFLQHNSFWPGRKTSVLSLKGETLNDSIFNDMSADLQVVCLQIWAYHRIPWNWNILKRYIYIYITMYFYVYTANIYVYIQYISWNIKKSADVQKAYKGIFQFYRWNVKCIQALQG